MPGFPRQIEVIDSHTGGEPTRVVVAGGPDLGKGTALERRERFRNGFDVWRQGLIHEPRGNSVLVGALLLEPGLPQCAAAVVYFNNGSYLGMCGHGTIGLGVTMHHLGRIGLGVHDLETPVGVVRMTLHDANTVSVENVPAWRFRASVPVDVPGLGRVSGDIAWGGNWFFLARELPVPLGEISPAEAPRLLGLTQAIRAALWQSGITGPSGEELDHVELFGPPGDLPADSRNFVLCPGGAWDRSPCGTGTSAKLACLAADGKLKPGEIWRQASTTGSIFECHYRTEGDRIVPVLKGTAWITAKSTLNFDPDDPFRWGIGI